jgi:hypothetical protein
MSSLTRQQTIDFDPDVEAIRVLVTAKAAEIEAQKVHHSGDQWT